MLEKARLDIWTQQVLYNIKYGSTAGNADFYPFWNTIQKLLYFCCTVQFKEWFL